jgi:hypothetical protein
MALAGIGARVPALTRWASFCRASGAGLGAMRLNQVAVRRQGPASRPQQPRLGFPRNPYRVPRNVWNYLVYLPPARSVNKWAGYYAFEGKNATPGAWTNFSDKRVSRLEELRPLRFRSDLKCFT